jgi:hypothetical protein
MVLHEIAVRSIATIFPARIQQQTDKDNINVQEVHNHTHTQIRINLPRQLPKLSKDFIPVVLLPMNAQDGHILQQTALKIYKEAQMSISN